MEKEIDRIAKNQDTDIVIRIDEFNGFKGLTIREFVKSERYTGFTKSGTRIPADKFTLFKQAINSIDEKDLEKAVEEQAAQQQTQDTNNQKKLVNNKEDNSKAKASDIEEVEF